LAIVRTDQHPLRYVSVVVVVVVVVARGTCRFDAK